MRHFTKLFPLAVLLIVGTAGTAFAANSLDVNAGAALQEEDPPFNNEEATRKAWYAYADLADRLDATLLKKQAA